MIWRLRRLFTRLSKLGINPISRLMQFYASDIEDRQTESGCFYFRVKERQMTWLTESDVRGTLTRTALAAAIAGASMIGATVLANTQDDPACDMLGWRHPLCAGGAFDQPPDDGIPGDNAATGGIPAPAMVPNIDGTLSLPGTPGAI
jgi:hypothetical protein